MARRLYQELMVRVTGRAVQLHGATNSHTDIHTDATPIPPSHPMINKRHEPPNPANTRRHTNATTRHPPARSLLTLAATALLPTLAAAQPPVAAPKAPAQGGLQAAPPVAPGGQKTTLRTAPDTDSAATDIRTRAPQARQPLAARPTEAQPDHTLADIAYFTAALTGLAAGGTATAIGISFLAWQGGCITQTADGLCTAREYPAENTELLGGITTGSGLLITAIAVWLLADENLRTMHKTNSVQASFSAGTDHAMATIRASF